MMHILAYILDFLVLMVEGLVGSIMWNWFLVPYFLLFPISIPLAIGFRLTVQVFVASNYLTLSTVEKSWEELSVGYALHILGALVILFFGFILKLVIGV